ncbi:MAG: hypothetical protein L0Z07_08355 [Planctomycetes bacterium]|nr:hypothetical protein [Planctomycetota bacterium]
MLNHVLLLADQTLPPMDGAYWLMLASRVLHILGAIILVGGIFYVRMIAHRDPPASPSRTADVLFSGNRAKWAMWVGIATLLLVATGLFNYVMFMRTFDRFAGTYHMLFGIKFLLGLAVLFIAAVLAGRSAAADCFRQNLRCWLSLVLLLSLAIVVLAAMMRTVPHVPKPAAGPPALIAPMNADN